jgi:hypothetical protein
MIPFFSFHLPSAFDEINPKDAEYLAAARAPECTLLRNVPSSQLPNHHDSSMIQAPPPIFSFSRMR